LLGFANTIDSMMGSESDVCIWMLDGERDVHWVEDKRSVVAMSRARKLLHIVSPQWSLESGGGIDDYGREIPHPLNKLLFSREAQFNRQFYYMKNLPPSLQLGALEILQLVYGNKPAVRASDMSKYMEYGTRLRIEEQEQEEDDSGSDSDSDSDSSSSDSDDDGGDDDGYDISPSSKRQRKA
jgi:hypothetical protein